MRRRSGEARTVPDHLRVVGSKADEASRAAGRGATQLRDSAGNTLAMNPDAPYPLVHARGTDVAVAFGADGAVKIVSPDTQEDRDFTARQLTASGGAALLGDSSVEGHLGVVGQLEADTMGTKTLGVGTVNAGRVNTGSTWMAGGVLRLDGGNLVTDFNNGASGGTVYTLKVECGDVVYNNLIKRSDEGLKERRRKLGRSAAAAVAETAWDMWSYRTDATRVGEGEGDQQVVPDPEPAVVPPPSGPIAWATSTGGLIVPSTVADAVAAENDPPMPESMAIDPQRDQIGPMAAELAENPLLAVCVIYDEHGTAVGVDYASLVGVLGAAVAEHHVRLLAQARTIAGLREQQKNDRDRLDALEARAQEDRARIERLEQLFAGGG